MIKDAIQDQVIDQGQELAIDLAIFQKLKMVRVAQRADQGLGAGPIYRAMPALHAQTVESRGVGTTEDDQGPEGIMTTTLGDEVMPVNHSSTAGCQERTGMEDTRGQGDTITIQGHVIGRSLRHEWMALSQGAMEKGVGTPGRRDIVITPGRDITRPMTAGSRVDRLATGENLGTAGMAAIQGRDTMAIAHAPDEMDVEIVTVTLRIHLPSETRAGTDPHVVGHRELALAAKERNTSRRMTLASRLGSKARSIPMLASLQHKATVHLRSNRQMEPLHSQPRARVAVQIRCQAQMPQA